MIKSDRWIRRMAKEHDMINPYSEKQVSQGVISYGVFSYGYDLRVADDFKIFTNVNSTIVDPKNFDERSFVTVNADVAIIPPNSFALARSVEYFKIVHRQSKTGPKSSGHHCERMQSSWKSFMPALTSDFR